MSFAPLSVDRSARDRSTRPAALSSHVWTAARAGLATAVAAIACVG
ncbi:hypothetical protein [Burkholderia orbicola]